MARDEFIKDVASQRLHFTAKEGRPSATPSVLIETQGKNVTTANATTFVTLESITTTLTGTASRGATSITITAGSPVVGETYILTNAGGQIERVRVVEDASSVLEIGKGLEFDHTTASTFESSRYYYTLQTADYNQLRESMQATATYVVGGLTHTKRMLFDVVYQPLVNPLTRDLIISYHPDIFDQQPPEQAGEDFRLQRDAAWSRVKQGIRQKGRRPALVVSEQDLVEWALAEFRLILAEMGVEVIRGTGDKLEELRMLRDERETEKQIATASLSWYDFNESDSLSEDEVHRKHLHLIR